MITASAAMAQRQACVPGLLLYVDVNHIGPYRPNGTAIAPYLSIKMANDSAVARNYCTVNLFVKKGLHNNEIISFDRAATIKGESRSETIINQGGLWSMVPVDLTLWDLTFKNSSARAILKKDGTIHLNRITVDNYHYVSGPYLPTPSAIQLLNVQGSITGLEVTNSDQPNFRLTGANSNISVLGLVTSNSKFIPGYDDSNYNYASSVEVLDGAKFKLVGGKITGAQSIGLLISGSVAKIAYSEIHDTTKSGSIYGNNFAMMNGSQVQANYLTSTGAELAGLVMMGSTFLGDSITIKGNYFGAAMNIDASPGDYSAGQCFMFKNMTTVTGNTKLDFLYTGKIGGPVSLPTQPLPLPCPQGQVCPTPTPVPTPVPVPANCYPVNL